MAGECACRLPVLPARGSQGDSAAKEQDLYQGGMVHFTKNRCEAPGILALSDWTPGRSYRGLEAQSVGAILPSGPRWPHAAFRCPCQRRSRHRSPRACLRLSSAPRWRRHAERATCRWRRCRRCSDTRSVRRRRGMWRRVPRGCGSVLSGCGRVAVRVRQASPSAAAAASWHRCSSAVYASAGPQPQRAASAWARCSALVPSSRHTR